MTKSEILIEIANRKLNGVMIHSDVCDIFNLMGFEKLKNQHQEQMLLEQKEYSSIKCFAIKEINKIPVPKNDFTRINPLQVIQNGERMQITREQKATVYYEMMEFLINYESKTISYFSEWAKQLLQIDEMVAFNKVNCLIQSTNIELEGYKKELIKYNDLNRNIDFIILENNY